MELTKEEKAAIKAANFAGVKISDNLPVDYYGFEAGSFRYTVEP